METIATIAELRKAFWQGQGYLKRLYTSRKTQNECAEFVHTEWAEFVACMQRTGAISEALANRATL